MKEEKNKENQSFSGCPGSRMMKLKTESKNHESLNDDKTRLSMLRQWPVQIQLVPYNAPYFNGADLLIAADCTAYAYGDFHSFMENKITIIGCPKLDDTDYSEKLTHILRSNNIKSLTVIRMERSLWWHSSCC